ncbi:hypothetical protein FQZ97_788180 [compost metagenome]
MMRFQNRRTVQPDPTGILRLEEAVGIILTASDNQGDVHSGEIYRWQLLLLKPAQVVQSAGLGLRRSQFDTFGEITLFQHMR